MEIQITQQELKDWSKIIAPCMALILAVIIGKWAGNLIKPLHLPLPTPLNFSFNSQEKQTGALKWQQPKTQADLFQQKKNIPLLPEPSSPSENNEQMLDTKELHLSFIIFNNNRKLCKINDSFLKEGQIINGLRIKKITHTGVWLEPATFSMNAAASGQSYFIHIGQKINITTPLSSEVN